MHAPSTTMNNGLYTEAEAAQFLSVSPRTLQAWRVRGGGPAYVKLGKSVRYRQEDLNSFIEGKVTGSTSEVAAAGGAGQ